MKTVHIGLTPRYHLKFEDPEAFRVSVEAYFANTPEHEWTMAGLAADLGTTVNMLRNNLAKREGGVSKFAEIVESAKTLIEARVERQLLSGKGGAAEIFWLKNAGWSDRQELDAKVSGDVHINVISYAPTSGQTAQGLESGHTVQLSSPAISVALPTGDGIREEAGGMDSASPEREG
jgi:hypothetical protein